MTSGREMGAWEGRVVGYKEMIVRWRIETRVD
jgi:hypothetical protein